MIMKQNFQVLNPIQVVFLIYNLSAKTNSNNEDMINYVGIF